MRAYLDHAATTPMLPEAVEAMLPYLSGDLRQPVRGPTTRPGGPGRAVDDARQLVAELVGADLGEVVFTGSGTEADNLAVTGAVGAAAAVRTGGRPAVPGPLVCSAMEHHAVLTTCRATARGWVSSSARCRPPPTGGVDLEALAEAVTPDVSLVSVMAVNNEIGTVQPLEAVARLVRAGRRKRCSTPTPCRPAPWLDLADLTARRPTWLTSAPTSSGGRRGSACWWSGTACRSSR